MSKTAKSSLKPRKPNGAKPRRLKIGRDVFALLVVGLGIGLGFVWIGIDVSPATTLLKSIPAQLRELASVFSQQSENDSLPVASIGDRTRTRKGDPRRYPVCTDKTARDNCVVDGDTFHMNGATIRISDIDAPETHPPRCAYEADLGDRATRRLSQLLSAGAFQLVRADRDLDKYGRQLRVVIRDGRSIGKMLVVEGLARSWNGKRRPWCMGQDSLG